ncbi:MAG: Rdx family protein [Deltaproteobacteria bacterium]|nr:Rdx family protein [Deltaproteobacteria bacterium]
MAAAIERETGTKPTLIRGDGGVFEVTADGALLFSKKKAGRFPTEAEVLKALRQS